MSSNKKILLNKKVSILSKKIVFLSKKIFILSKKNILVDKKVLILSKKKVFLSKKIIFLPKKVFIPGEKVLRLPGKLFLTPLRTWKCPKSFRHQAPKTPKRPGKTLYAYLNCLRWRKRTYPSTVSFIFCTFSVSSPQKSRVKGSSSNTISNKRNHLAGEKYLWAYFSFPSNI